MLPALPRSGTTLAVDERPPVQFPFRARRLHKRQDFSFRFLPLSPFVIRHVDRRSTVGAIDDVERFSFRFLRCESVIVLFHHFIFFHRDGGRWVALFP